MKENRLRLVEHEIPHNAHAEGVVLGTLINFPEQIEKVADMLQPDDFYTIRHKVLYEIMLSVYRKHGKGADFLVLAHLLEGREDLDSADLVELMGLRDELWSVDLAADARLILGASTQRQIIFAAQKLAGVGYRISDPDEARAACEKLLYDLSMGQASTSDFSSMEEVLVDCVADIETAWQHRGEMLGIPTGFTDLDLMTNGLQRSDLIVLAGRPGFGKTSLGMGIGYNAAKRGCSVAVFSLEMGKKQLGNRMISLVSRIPTNRLRAGWLEDDDWQKVVDAQDHLSELCLYIDDTVGTPIASIRSKLRRLAARLGRPIDLVIVDYLQLMDDDDLSEGKRANRNEEIARISRGLKGIAREFNLPVLALAQINRQVEGRSNKIPQLSDIRDSGAVEQDADIVMFVYRDEAYDPQSERKGVTDVIVAKHRNGPTGTVTLAYNGALTRFDNLEAVSPVERQCAG